MNVKLKINSLRATQVLRDNNNNEDFWELAKYFPCKRFGDDEAGGYFLESSHGIVLEPHWDEWLIWKESDPLMVLSDEKFKELFEDSGE